MGNLATIEPLPPLPGGLLSEDEERQIEYMLKRQDEIDEILSDIEWQANEGLISNGAAWWAMRSLERLGDGYNSSQPN